MSMGHTYKLLGFYISYIILNLPLSIFYLPFMLLILCTFSFSNTSTSGVLLLPTARKWVFVWLSLSFGNSLCLWQREQMWLWLRGCGWVGQGKDSLVTYNHDLHQGWAKRALSGILPVILLGLPSLPSLVHSPIPSFSLGMLPHKSHTNPCLRVCFWEHNSVCYLGKKVRSAVWLADEVLF